MTGNIPIILNEEIHPIRTEKKIFMQKKLPHKSFSKAH